MQKIIIIGSKGMAGHVIYYSLKETTRFQVIDIARDDEFFTPAYKLDASDFARLESILAKEQPDVVINCIGILNQDAEDNPGKAILLNAYLPHYLETMGTRLGFKLIHISTDCVFSGREGGYTETSPKDGIGFYAQSKALGEVNSGNHLTLRTSIIGPELKEKGIGLFHWFMNQAGEIKGYTQAFWTGVTTIELAKAVIAAIDQNISGIHHLVNDSKISKYDLLNLINDVFDRNITILPYESYKVDKSLIRTNTSFDYVVPAYKEMIIEMKEWISKHSTIYNYKN